MEAPVVLEPINFDEPFAGSDADVDDYVPALDPGAEEYRRQQARREAATFGKRYYNKVRETKYAKPTEDPKLRRAPIGTALVEVPEATYSAQYTETVPPIMNSPEVILKGSGYQVTPRSKAIKNAEVTPVSKTVKVLKKQYAQTQTVAAGEDRVRAIQHDSFCSTMKQEAIKKISKYLSQLPPKQQIMYETRLNNLTQWRSTAKGGKARTPKPFDKVNLRALMRLSFFLEKKALWYASVDLRRASRHSRSCGKEFAPKKRAKAQSK